MRKLYIVKNVREFEDIIKTGKVIKNSSFIIYFKENNLKYNRYGISVGKKLGNAVYRNKYKRKIRAIVDNSPKSNLKPRDYIIILRKSAKDKKYSELEKDFTTLINLKGKGICHEEEK